LGSADAPYLGEDHLIGWPRLKTSQCSLVKLGIKTSKLPQPPKPRECIQLTGPSAAIHEIKEEAICARTDKHDTPGENLRGIQTSVSDLCPVKPFGRRKHFKCELSRWVPRVLWLA
jgi:hypothetical protein